LGWVYNGFTIVAKGKIVGTCCIFGICDRSELMEPMERHSAMPLLRQTCACHAWISGLRIKAWERIASEILMVMGRGYISHTSNRKTKSCAKSRGSNSLHEPDRAGDRFMGATRA
jgi:hypothetical protein